MLNISGFKNYPSVSISLTTVMRYSRAKLLRN